MWSTADVTSRVLSGGELLLSALLNFHRCFSHNNPSLLRERSAHKRQQLAGLFVGLGGGYKADVHTAYLVNLVIVDLRENELLLESHVVVASAVEGVGVDAPEVSYAGKRNIEESVEELIHSVASQRDLHADGHAFSELEVCN